MSVSPLGSSDSLVGVLGAALDGLSVRQRVIADNIANIDTPGFRAMSVDFESSLRAAAESGDLSDSSLALIETPTGTPVGANGNNVDLRKESMAAMQTQFQYQLVTRAVTDHFDLIRMTAGQ